jgi:hypothetical protein
MKPAHRWDDELSLVHGQPTPYREAMAQPHRSKLAAVDFTPTRPLAIVVIAHVDTGPLWYQWMSRAGHNVWLWYGTDTTAGAERLVRETSPDLLVVHATCADDPGWTQVRTVRERFLHARLPVIAIVDEPPVPPEPDVMVLPRVESAWALLDAIDEATRPGSWIYTLTSCGMSNTSRRRGWPQSSRSTGSSKAPEMASPSPCSPTAASS